MLPNHGKRSHKRLPESEIVQRLTLTPFCGSGSKRFTGLRITISGSAQSRENVFDKKLEEFEDIGAREVPSERIELVAICDGMSSPDAKSAIRLKRSFAAFLDARIRGEGEGCGSLSFGKLSGTTCNHIVVRKKMCYLLIEVARTLSSI